MLSKLYKSTPIFVLAAYAFIGIKGFITIGIEDKTAISLLDFISLIVAAMILLWILMLSITTTNDNAQPLKKTIKLIIIYATIFASVAIATHALNTMHEPTLGYYQTG